MGEGAAGMDETNRGDPAQARLLGTLERLLALEPTGLRPALDSAAQLVAEALGADKIDAFLHDPSIDSLVAVGTSDTPMGRKQHAIGLERLPLANGGRLVQVFEAGESYRTGHAEEDPEELIGITQGLGIRSQMAALLIVGGQRRGILTAASATPERFSVGDLRFLEAAARWVGVVAHRAELTERLAIDAASAARSAAADELIAVVAHDLNNLLAPLKARLDILRRRAGRLSPEEIASHAEGAASAVARIRRFVGNLLDAERLERGAFSLEPQPVDLAALAREVVEAVASDSGAVRVQAPSTLVVAADPERVRQALENLVGNALRHSPLGAEVLVEVSAAPPAVGDDAASATSWASLSVADHGPGVPPDLLPRLFDRFAKGPDSVGLGLGLYIARRVAEAHGGTLTVESEPGWGACFRLAFPADGYELSHRIDNEPAP